METGLEPEPRYRREWVETSGSFTVWKKWMRPWEGKKKSVRLAETRKGEIRARV